MADFVAGKHDSTPSGMYVRPPYQQDRARQLEVYVGEFPGRTRVQHEMANDERQSNRLHETTPAITGGIYTGRISQVVPYLNWYKVALDGAKGDIGCCRGSPLASLPMATASADLLPPNCQVLVHVPHHGGYGVILCCIPDLVEDSNFVQPDWISQGSNVGFKREKYYWQLLTQLEREGGCLDFSSNRPMDATAMGEWGRFTHTGGGIHLDPFMAFLRQDETCGLWLFYMDHLARLCGYNMDIRTSISERVIRNDQGEGHGFYGYNGYPWQVMGAWGPSDTPHREVEDKDVQYEKPYSKYEVQPEQEDLMPFYRTEEYEGYCGQGFMRQVMLPPQGKKSGLNRYADTDARIGVFREQIGYDGSYALTSAHSIHIQKRILIPIPKRLRLIEDEKTGDMQPWDGGGNYKFASQWGDGPEHKVTNPKAEDSQPHYQMAAALTDLQAYAFNWKSLHPFVYHQKDFDLPEEDKIQPFTTLLKVPTFSDLQTKATLTRPDPKTAWVDSRYSDQDYFETTAGISITPDGCVVIRDAYGAELKSGGGNWFLSAPGDIYFQSGRNIVAYGGDDVVLRARQSVDIAAANHDVRIKAEYNCDILAGNNGQQGRLLLECQAAAIKHDYIGKQGEDVQSSGVLVKARNSQFAALADEIYLRTGSSGGKIGGGNIVLDADEGNADIRTHSRVLANHVQLWCADAFPQDEGKKTVHFRSDILAMTPTAHEVLGGLYICKNGIQMRDWILVAKGHIATEYAPQYNQLVDILDGARLDTVNQNIDTVLGQFKDWNDKLDEDYDEHIQQAFLADGKIGADEMELKLEFAPRTAKQMDTEEWWLPETYWQQLARLGEQKPGTWKEPDIIYQGEKMTPHPGRTAWKVTKDHLQLDLNYHDVNKGLDKPHGSGSGSAYETPQLKSWTRVIPDDQYLIVKTS